MEKVKISIMTNWKNIHPDSTPELQKEWKEKGFDYWETKQWIERDINLSECDFVIYLKQNGYTPLLLI